MKLPESMPDLLEKVVEPLTPSTETGSWYSRLPMKLALALPLGAVLGLYVIFRSARLGGGVGALVAGGAVTVAVWLLGIGVTIYDHFETKKRRANKRPPASFG
jgi:hypothetical protein